MKKKSIYCTQEWKGYGKQSFYHNEYRQEGDDVEQVKCGRFKSFDGKENNWCSSERVVKKWKVGDEGIPSWLNKYIK